MILTSVAIILRVLSNPLGNVFQKQLTNRYNHPLLINFLTFLLLSVFCIIPAIQVRWLELPFEFWKYCILAGIVGATGNGFLVKALQCGDLSVLGPINSYKSVVGIIVGIFLLGEIPNLWGIAEVHLVKEFKRIKIRDLSSYFYLVLCIGTMQYTTNYVFDHMEVGYALAWFQLATIVSIFLGYRIFKEENITKKLIGSVIMVAGSVMIILLK